MQGYAQSSSPVDFIRILRGKARSYHLLLQTADQVQTSSDLTLSSTMEEGCLLPRCMAYHEMPAEVLWFLQFLVTLLVLALGLKVMSGAFTCSKNIYRGKSIQFFK